MAEASGEKTKPKKLTPEERRRIVDLARGGYTINEIATELVLPPKQVSGAVNSAKNRGEIEIIRTKANNSAPPGHEPAPSNFAPAPTLPGNPPVVLPSLPQEDAMHQQPQVPMQGQQPGPAPLAPAPAMSAPAPVPAPVPPPYGGAQSDSFNWRTGAPGNGQGNFSFSQNQIRYVVTRIVPNDGILGTHPHPFEPTDVGRQYGAGTYTVTKQEPGRPPVVSDPIVISRSFGEPRFGQQESRSQEGRRPMFPRYDRGDRGGDLSEDDGTIRVAPRPQYDPRLSEFARQPVRDAGAETMATTAFQIMGKLQEQQLKENADLRRNGPDNWLQQHFVAQQKQWEEQRERENAKREEERRRDDERREDDRKREEMRREDEKNREQKRLDEERRRDDARLADERRRAEEKATSDERNYTRRMEEEEKKHTREMERLKQESESRARYEAEQRQTILSLEQKKIEIIQTEAKAREEMMKQELNRHREDFNRVVQETTAQMADLEKNVSSQLDRERDQLRREFDIKNKALDNEHALRTEMLRLREETSSRGEGEAFTKMIEKIVTEVGKNVKEVVELKKMEVMSPEAQAAHIHRATDGNILTNPQAAAARSTPAPAAAAREAAASESEVAETEEAPEKVALAGSEGGKVDDIVREQLKSGLAQELLKEWVMHVGAQSPPSMFINMFVQYMRSENEKQAQACTTFATYITPRNWQAMKEVLWPVLSEEQQKVLGTEYAEEFYEGFRGLAVDAVNEYWEAFAVARQEQRERRAQAKPAVPAASAAKSNGA